MLAYGLSTKSPPARAGDGEARGRDRACVAAHDLMGPGQSAAGAADVLRRGGRLEGHAHGYRRHAVAGIADGEVDEGVAPGDADDDGAALRHGVARVGD